MSLDETPLLPEVELAAAAAVRRLGLALLSRTVDPELSARVAEQAAELAAAVEEASGPRTKSEAYVTYNGDQRVQHFLTAGRWPPPPPDGGDIDFDALSFVSGPLSPFSAGARYHRDGDEAVGRVTLDVGYEGPPERVHGGMVASLFDEVMGSVFRARSLPSAFTGSLQVRFERPAPLGVEIEFRARLAGIDGRKYRIEAEATGPEGRFASASAVFIEMAQEQVAATFGELDTGQGAPSEPDAAPETPAS